MRWVASCRNVTRVILNVSVTRKRDINYMINDSAIRTSWCTWSLLIDKEGTIYTFQNSVDLCDKNKISRPFWQFYSCMYVHCRLICDFEKATCNFVQWKIFKESRNTQNTYRWYIFCKCVHSLICKIISFTQQHIMN